MPGYRLLNGQVSTSRRSTQAGRALVTTFVEVEGAGDYLPPYAASLDIMTAAYQGGRGEIAKELVVGGAR